jgi:outer membrane protein, multidrug efflux system
MRDVRRGTAAALVVVIAALACGCRTVGPDYERPPVTVPDAYRGLPADQAGRAESASFGDQQWWEVFEDETLQGLIRTAVEQNYDVRIAAARILQARAQLGIARANQLPTASAGAAAANERIPKSLAAPAVDTSVYQLTASAEWELDFWGKFRRATEAARANLLANEWARREVIRTVVSEVASSYFQLRELDLELEISQQTLTSRRDSLRLTQLRADRGATSLLDVRQAEQLVFGAAASIPDLEQRIEQQENFISTLTGGNPQAVPRGGRLTEQPHPPEVPAGLPSALLERRPDIRQAEQEVVATNASIGVAKADYFPQISLTGTGGFQSAALASLFSGPAGLWTLAAGASQPIFQGGRLRSRVELAEAQRQEAALVYQRTIQQAFREVSDALVAYRKSQAFRVEQEQLTRSAEDATRLSNIRYTGGATSYLEVLDSDSRKFAAQLNLAQAQLNELQSMVRIYRALGGGWQ